MIADLPLHEEGGGGRLFFDKVAAVEVAEHEQLKGDHPHGSSLDGFSDLCMSLRVEWIVTTHGDATVGR